MKPMSVSPMAPPNLQNLTHRTADRLDSESFVQTPLSMRATFSQPFKRR